jgi:hypothetical protein
VSLTAPPPPEPRSLDEAVGCVVAQLRHLVAPDMVVELRALKVRRGTGKPHTEAGFFDFGHLGEMARAALEVSPHARGVYFTLNALNPDLLARRCNRMGWAEEGELTTDKDVSARRWLLVDADPVRAAHISATDGEKGHALEAIGGVRAFLQSRGWPDPILADSGNGYHLLYRVDLPADDGGLVGRVLRVLAARFDTDSARIDTSVGNASRICKVPGTLARKGDSTPSRPHRRARLVDVLGAGAAVAGRALLESLVAEFAPPAAISAPPPRPSPTPAGEYSSRLCVARWLANRGVSFRRKDRPDAKDRTVYVLAASPFDSAHAHPDACVMQAADGAMSAHCFHASCATHGWQAFKQKIGPPDPHHYDPPLTSRRNRGSPARDAATRRSDPPGGPIPPLGEDSNRGESRPTITINPQTTPVAETMRAITDRLAAAGDCYRRAGQLVRIANATVTPILSAPELAGLLNSHAEVQLVGEGRAEYKPLPNAYANTWLKHPGEATRLPAVALFTQNPVYTDDWRLAPPGYDPASGIYYAGPPVEARASTARLDALLRDFCFRTAADRTNFVGVLLTAILVPRFIGSKPAVLFSGNQPGLGKSMLAQIVATVRDGRPVETVTYNPNDEEFEKRLGAAVRRGSTTIIIDNAKATSRGRTPRIESACLERSITDPVLSFRLLGQSSEIRAENSHIFCLTANTPDVSPDLVTRSVLVALFHEGDPARRQFAIEDPEQFAADHRVELLGELVGMVERWKAAGGPRAEVRSRFNKKGWGPIVVGILAANGFAGFLANAEAAAGELDDTRREFAYLVALLADHPQGTWTAAELAERVHQNDLFPSEFENLSPRGRST